MSAKSPYEHLEPVESASLGPGWLAEANEHQPKDLILFDKKRPPTGEDGRPVFAVVYGSEEPVCGSKKRGKAAYCSTTARMENGRCEDHGGKSLRGMASRRYKTGEHSKWAPRVAGHLQERFDLLMADETLHHHRRSIASLDAMLDELWERFSEGWDADLAKRALGLYRSMNAARAANNRLRAMELLEELGPVLEDMVHVDAQADKIVRFLSERRKHADSETRRMISERLVFSLEEAQMFYSALGAAVNRNVSNEEEPRAILSEIASVAGARPGSAHIG